MVMDLLTCEDEMKIMVALPPAKDLSMAGKLKWKKPGSGNVQEFYTEMPSEADDSDPVVIRALAKGDLIKVEKE